MTNNMYDTFDNKPILYYDPYSFKYNDRMPYMEKNVKATYVMNYGDTTVIPFQISCEYQGYYINMIVYNSRMEEIYCDSKLPDETGKVYLDIDEEISRTIFKKGHYYIQVQAEGYVQMLIQVNTLISPEDCTIYVR